MISLATSPSSPQHMFPTYITSDEEIYLQHCNLYQYELGLNAQKGQSGLSVPAACWGLTSGWEVWAGERPAGRFMQGFAEYNGDNGEVMQGFTRKGYEQPSLKPVERRQHHFPYEHSFFLPKYLIKRDCHV
ncbi:hypothetical protein E2C01_031247 [Portunus trituberculatus]|uniref:Uncharacterized protein n=1 Tax=Portunus trituberculatus TaxID=210409 RepID=A0A5B7EX58_PORTR|nr:hypothetical protein [Portunus trituberculatus]